MGGGVKMVSSYGQARHAGGPAYTYRGLCAPAELSRAEVPCDAYRCRRVYRSGAVLTASRAEVLGDVTMLYV